MDNNGKGFVPDSANYNWNYGDLAAITQKELKIESTGSEPAPSGNVDLENTNLEQLYPQEMAQKDAIKAVAWEANSPDLADRLRVARDTQGAAREVLSDSPAGVDFLDTIDKEVRARIQSEPLHELHYEDLVYLQKSAFNPENPDKVARAYLASHASQIAELAFRSDSAFSLQTSQCRDILKIAAIRYGRGGNEEVPELAALMPDILRNMAIEEKGMLGSGIQQDVTMAVFSRQIALSLQYAVINGRDPGNQITAVYLENINDLLTRQSNPHNGPEVPLGQVEQTGVNFFTQIVSEQNTKVNPEILKTAYSWCLSVLNNDKFYPYTTIAKVHDALIAAKDMPGFPKEEVESLVLPLATTKFKTSTAPSPMRNLANQYFITQLSPKDNAEIRTHAIEYAEYAADHPIEVGDFTIRLIKEALLTGVVRSQAYPPRLIKLLSRFILQDGK